MTAGISLIPGKTGAHRRCEWTAVAYSSRGAA